MEIEFLTVEEVRRIHQDQISRYGGSPGVRDEGLLLSALAQPGTRFGGEFLHPDLFLMAAAYLFHLARNHAFIDGNKRVAAVSCIVFLGLNGQRLRCTEDELVDLVLRTARGELEKSSVAGFLRTACSG